MDGVLSVTEKSYKQKLAKGIDPESLLKPGSHRFSRTRHVSKPEETVTVNGKSRVTMYLDSDVIEFFRKRGSHYQTEINQALRQLVDRERYAQELVSDEVVEKLAGRLAETLKDQAA
jgi:uncharacterized protein (DUF4415 family)